MHDTALELGRLFFDHYMPRGDGPAFILDIGSLDINGSLRSVLSEDRLSRYTGVDLAAGPGVDLVIESAQELPFPDETFHLIVSTSCFEHDEAFWATFDEAARVLAPGGYLYLNAPSNGHVHQHPLDCWRFYPDAGVALARWANRGRAEPLIVLMESFVFDRTGCEWNDAVMVFAKLPLHGAAVEPLSHHPNAKNIRRLGHEGLGRYEPFTEDQRIGLLIATTTNHLMGTLRAETEESLRNGAPLFSVLIHYDPETASPDDFSRCLTSIEQNDVPLEIFIIRPDWHHPPIPVKPIYFVVESRQDALEDASGIYVLETDARSEYGPGALAEVAAQLRAEPVGMLVTEFDAVRVCSVSSDSVNSDSVVREATNERRSSSPPFDSMQVVLRRGVASAHSSPDYEAITNDIGFCRCPIVIGKKRV